MNEHFDNWKSGDPYEYFMGRWSRQMAPVFLKWLDMPEGLTWLDLGCGTGALSKAILDSYNPLKILCVDPSENFLEKARERLCPKGELITGTASEIPADNGSFDVIVSGLALNFFPDLNAAFSEMKRVSKSGGIIASYVWDYAGRMDFLRYFWDAAHTIDPGSRDLDEGLRFHLCNPDKLKNLFDQNGLTDIETEALDIDTVFKSFDDYWDPFLGGQGPAPGYLASLSSGAKERLRDLIHKNLPQDPDGIIKLKARAFGILGRN